MFFLLAIFNMFLGLMNGDNLLVLIDIVGIIFPEAVARIDKLPMKVHREELIN